MIWSIGRALLLIISFLGYFVYVTRKTGEAAIAPILVFASVGVLMFAAGLLNVMVAMCYLIVLGGIVLLVWCIRRDGWAMLQKKELAILGIFAAFCALLFVRLYGQVPLHYDNFSHWLTVVREMLKNDRMPNFLSSIIMFQGYPTGSAGFIYFIMKMLAVSRDDFALFAQALLLAAALMAPLALAKKVDVWSVAVWALCAVFCLVANNSIENLLVDTLISVLSIAAIAVVVRYRETPRKAFCFSLPMQIYLVAVKNSGILMLGLNCAIMLAVFLYTKWEQGALNKKTFGQTLGYTVASGGIPAVVYYLWLRHVKLVYANGVTAKHTASISNYIQGLGNKTTEQITEILQLFARRFFSWNVAWVYLIVFAAVLALGYLLRRRVSGDKRCAEAWIFAAMLCAYLAFMAVLAAMYILSMPYGESVVLASYGRYEWTVLIYLVGLMEIYALSTLRTERPKGGLNLAWRGGLVCLAVWLAVSQWTGVMKLVQRSDEYETSSRRKLEQIKEEYDLPENSTYLIVGSSIANDSGYHYYLGRYVLWSFGVDVCTPDALADLEPNQKWLVILESSEEVDAFLRARGLEPGQSVYALR